MEVALRDGHEANRVVVLPGLNHFFQTAPTGAPREYGMIEETVSPALLDLVLDWIRGQILN
jgi:hypothetical protein